MRRSVAIIVNVAVALSCGCAARRAAPASRADESSASAISPAARPVALLSLDEIQPHPLLPTTAPSTQPASPPPLEAVELYARARASLLQNQRYTGITLLEQAIALDPQSFELNYTLARAYLIVGMNDRSLATFERAAQLNPGDLDVQSELGRAYYNRGDMPRAIQHLRLARQTQEYADGEPLATLVDYRLAVSLHRQGYERASLQVYDELLKRLQHPTPQMRSNAEVAYLLVRPESLLRDLANLYERRGLNDEAIKALEFIAQRNPDDFANQSKIISLLIAANRDDEAVARAAEVVRRSGASPESLALLRETYQKLGRESEMLIELRRLHAEHPNDRAILYALAEALEANGRRDDAESLLTDALRRRADDAEILGRLVQLYAERGQITRAAQFLIEAAARNPEACAELEIQWSRLLRPSRRDALRLDQIRDLHVSADATAAKWFYVNRVAQAWNREYPARQALQRSINADPPFPPAYRAVSAQIWSDPSLPDDVKAARAQELVDSARRKSLNSLADEIQGMLLLEQKHTSGAIESLARAVSESHPPSPETELALAGAYRIAGNSGRFEQIGWRLVSEHPRFAAAYAALFRHYLDSGQLNGARRALSAWLANLPNDIDARLLEATLQLRVSNQRDEAERSLLALHAANADDAQVLANIRAFYAEQEQLPRFIDMLDDELARHPQNFVALAILVDVYSTQGRDDDATRALDHARNAMADDPDRLYFIAHLYQRLQQDAVTEEVLQAVLAIDPSYAPAANDLGYTWADAGINLERAETLLRRAIESEPENPMFLDSLGWVMYKRGRFDEARRNLEQAVAANHASDPVVLDHLGDVLYRMNLPAEAANCWRQSLARLGDAAAAERDESKDLRLQLELKLKQSDTGEVVSVSPVIENPTMQPKQAKIERR